MEKAGKTHSQLQQELAALKSQLAEFTNGRAMASPDGALPLSEIVQNFTAALLESETRYQELVDLLPEIVFELDTRGVVTFINRQGLALTGYTQEDFDQGFEGINLFILQDHPRIRRTIQDIFRGLPTSPAEYTARRKNGETFPSLTHSTPIRKDNKIIGIRGLVIDITAQSQSKWWFAQINRLQEELLGPGTLEQKTARITDGVVNVFKADFARIWITKPADRCETGCIHAREKQGIRRCVQRQECLHLVASSGRYTHLDGEMSQRVPFGYSKIGLIASGEMSSFLTNEVALDPNVHDQKWAKELGLVSFAGYRLLSIGGTPLGVLGIFSKTTISSEEEALLKNLATTAAYVIQAAQTEHALRASEARYRQLVEHSPLGIAVLDPDDKIIEANPRFLKITGCTASEIKNKPFYKLLTKEEHQKAYEQLVQLLESSRLENFELPYGDKTLKVNTALISKTPLLKMILIEDITAERLLAGQLRQAQKMEAIGNLAGGVAHDINNMLAVVMALSSVLKVDIEPDSPLQEDIAGILSACEKGHSLTKNLLGFARQGKYRKEALSLNLIIEEVFSLLKRSIPKKVTLCSRLDPQLELIEGDNNQINQVLVNLALNGVDAMQGEGTLIFTTANTILKEDEPSIPMNVLPGPYIRVDIMDTGCGMDQQTCQRAFDPFFTTKPVGQGTGLGLSMVYGTIKNHNGVVLLDSVIGQGTTVTIYLPVHRPVLPLVRIPTKELDVIQTGTGTILLVDDEKLILQVGKRLLEELGYEVLLAEDGLQAIQLYQEHAHAIDLIIMDLIMPKMSGEEAVLKLKQVNPEIQILLSSGYTQENIADKMFSLGVAGFVQKPYQVSELAAKIAKELKKKAPY